jgi:myo-inositol-1(or 4)-monophosphatase
MTTSEKNSDSPKLDDLKEMVLAAGDIVRRNYGQVRSVGKKGVIDLVTETDLESEKFLVEQIQNQFPNSSAVAEEGSGLEGDEDSMWFIDPIDGTVNFAHGLPIFCVSLGYQHKGELQHGVVYNPISENLFTASRDMGAELNGQTIQVSTAASLENSLLVTGFPYDTWTNPNNNLKEFNRLSKKTQGVRRLGSAALDLCYVAAGWLDGFWETSIKPWDIAAGGLIVREAGGIVSKLQGEEDFMSAPQSIVAANPVLHPLLLEELAK